MRIISTLYYIAMETAVLACTPFFSTPTRRQREAELAQARWLVAYGDVTHVWLTQASPTLVAQVTQEALRFAVERTAAAQARRHRA